MDRPFAAIDACALHEWATPAALGPYLPEGWRDVLLEPGVGVGISPLYPDLSAAKAGVGGLLSGSVFSEDLGPAEGGPPSCYDDLARDYLDRGVFDRVVLTYEAGLRATTNQNHF